MRELTMNEVQDVNGGVVWFAVAVPGVWAYGALALESVAIAAIAYYQLK